MARRRNEHVPRDMVLHGRSVVAGNRSDCCNFYSFGAQQVTGNHAERKHSKRSPSFSPIWRKCMQACNFADTLPDPPSSQAAQDGTFEHEWGEYCLRNGVWDAREYVGVTLEQRDKPLSMESAECVNAHLGLIEKILAPEDELFIEARLSLAKYFDGTEDGDGSTDCAIYKPATQHVHVIDYKGGRTDVQAKDNMQAIQYALGVWEMFKARGVKKITIWIVQPRCGPAKKWSISATDLFDHGLDLKDDYAKSKLPGQPFVPGSHCTFCRGNIYGKCAAIREHSEREAANGFVAVQRHSNGWRLTPQELGDMLKRAEPMRVYLKALDELAETEAIAGRVPVGRKWVATPGRRTWNPELGEDVAIAKAIQKIIPGCEVWDEKLKTAPALEKDLGKAEFKKLEALVKKSEGGFKLVSEDDPKPAVEYGRSSEGFEAVT